MAEHGANEKKSYSEINEDKDVIYMQVLCLKIRERHWKNKDEIIRIFKEFITLPHEINGIIHTKVYKSLRYDSDFIIWLSSRNPSTIREAMDIIYSKSGHLAKSTFSMLSIYVKSPYLKNATHIEEEFLLRRYLICPIRQM